MGRLTIPKEQAIEQALKRHQEGESLRDIAPSLGISHVRLRAILLGEVPEEYRKAQQESLIERIAEADELLQTAIVKDEDGRMDRDTSMVNIAHAREVGKFARWDAERRLPHLFGAKQTVEHKHTVDVAEALQDARKALANRRPSVTIDQ